MTSKKATAPKKNGVLLYTAKVAIIAVLAFIAALCFRQSSGILAMTPAAFILCGLASFVEIDWRIKTIIFGVTVFSLNTIEQTDMNITLTYTALCLLACLLFNIGARLIKKHKKSGVPVMSTGAVLCIALSVIFIGNPISAISAKSAINDYAERTYPSSENAALGEFEFSNIYYNFNTKAFESRATSSKYPTESGIISYSADTVYDGFQEIMKEKLCQPYILEITALLRKYYPDDSFSVSYKDIASKPGDRVLSATEGELYGRITYEIYLGGVQTANGMSEKVARYMQIIDGTDTEYSKIIFKSGISPWMLRSVTVDKNRPVGFDDFAVEHVHPQTSNRFNRYVSRFLSG